MFKFLKSFFEKKEEFELEILALPELLGKNESFLNSELKFFLSDFKETFESDLKILAQELSNLESADLLNKHISERERHILEGNKLAFIGKVRTFSQIITPPSDIGAIGNFLTNYGEKEGDLDSLNRSIMVLQQFHSNELKSVMSVLSSISSQVDNLKNNKFSFKISVAERIKKNLSNFKDLNEKILAEASALDGIFSSLSEKKIFLKSLFEEKEKLSYNSDLEFLDRELESAESENRKDAQSIRGAFNSVRPILQRYERSALNDKALVRQYVKDPVQALIFDKNYKILEILNEIKRLLTRGSFEIKDKKKDAALQSLEILNEDVLGSLLSRFGRSTALCSRKDAELRNHPVNKRLREITEMIKSTESEIEVLSNGKRLKEKNLSKLNSQLSSIDFNEDLSVLLDKSVVVNG